MGVQLLQLGGKGRVLRALRIHLLQLPLENSLLGSQGLIAGNQLLQPGNGLVSGSQLAVQLVQGGFQLFQLLQGSLQLALVLGQGGELGVDLGLGGLNLHLFGQQLALGLACLLGQLALAAFQLGLLPGQLVRLALGLIQALFNLLGAIVQLLLSIIEGGIQLGLHLRVQGVDFVLAQAYRDAFLHIAADRHAGHALNALQLGEQLSVQQVGQLDVVHALHLHGRHSDWEHTGVHLHDVRGAHHVVPAAGDRVQLFPDIRGEGVHVGVICKLQHHLGAVLPGHGGNLLHMVQGCHSLLNGPGDLVLHLLGGRARAGGDNDRIGQVDVGKQVRGHAGKGHSAQNNGDNDPHQHSQGFFDAEL